VRWALLLGDGGAPVLSEASAAAMQARQTTLDYVPGLDYGFGIMAERYKGSTSATTAATSPGGARC